MYFVVVKRFQKFQKWRWKVDKFSKSIRKKKKSLLIKKGNNNVRRFAQVTMNLVKMKKF